MAGKLYGVGIGPGDPKLMTIRAKEVLEDVMHIAVPVKTQGGESVALDIIRNAVDLNGKKIHPLVFLMEGGREQFEECGRAAGGYVKDILMSGDDVAMVSLGDIAVYSTYMYLNSYIESHGYETEIVPGVTSFSYAAALARVPLMLGDEGLAVITPRGCSISDAIRDFDNVVVMKSGKSMNEISKAMCENGIPPENAMVVSRGGMNGQYVGPINESSEFNYFTTTIIKKGG